MGGLLEVIASHVWNRHRCEVVVVRHDGTYRPCGALSLRESRRPPYPCFEHVEALR